jgi:hypothetical protein
MTAQCCLVWLDFQNRCPKPIQLLLRKRRGLSACIPSLEGTLLYIIQLAVPGHALLWLSLVKWKRKKRESARF